ncbi:MAG: hypothetical protein IJP54_08620 [Synergistaceae bacterium]|nr:hypothetical protein [Synergistaceae bacterium]MBR0035728.1 hypothetical protein [Synergistaceae bacterium]
MPKLITTLLIKHSHVKNLLRLVVQQGIPFAGYVMCDFSSPVFVPVYIIEHVINYNAMTNNSARRFSQLDEEKFIACLYFFALA